MDKVLESYFKLDSTNKLEGSLEYIRRKFIAKLKRDSISHFKGDKFCFSNEINK